MADTGFIFKSRDAATQHAILTYHASSDLRDRRLIGRDPIHHAGGHIFIYGPQKRRCRDGQIRDFFAYGIGA